MDQANKKNISINNNFLIFQINGKFKNILILVPLFKYNGKNN